MSDVCYKNGLYEAIRADGHKVVVAREDCAYSVELVHGSMGCVISSREFMGRNDFIRHLPMYSVSADQFKTL